MSITKIFGWALIAAGLIIIVWSLYSSYNIFTGKAVVPEFFKMEGKISQIPATGGKIPTSPTELQQNIENLISQQLKGILPVDTIPKLLNLIVWSILATILIFGGSQISGLGIKLIKK